MTATHLTINHPPMTQLNLENWKEHLKDNRINSYDQITQGHIESFIDQLLAVQKQSIKDEAVKRIEELSLLQNHRFSDGLDEAIEVIRNL